MWLISSKLSAWTYRSNPPLDVDPLPTKEDFIQTLDHEGEVLTVLNYNVNCDIYTEESVFKIVSAITLANTDVVCLVETHSQWEGFIKELISEELYPHRIWHHASGPGGIAILSKLPIVDDVILNNTEEVEGSWFPIWAGKVELSHHLIQICIVHLRPPLDQLGYQWSLTSPFTTNKYRKEEIKYLSNYLVKQGELYPTLILGDFNENDSGGSINYLTNNGKGNGIGLNNRTKNLPKNEIYLRDLKFKDAVNEFISQDIETHRWKLPGNIALRSRLDHILYSVDYFICGGCRVISGFEDEASDHLPVYGLFALKNLENKSTSEDGLPTNEVEKENLSQDST